MSRSVRIIFLLLVFASGAARVCGEEEGLLFHASYDKTIRADVSAAGKPMGKPVKHKARLVPGKTGKAMDIDRGGWVEYARPGHIQELEGSISFDFKTKFPGNEQTGMWRIFLQVDSDHFQFYKSLNGTTLRVAYKNFDYKPDAVQADISHVNPDEWHFDYGRMRDRWTQHLWRLRDRHHAWCTDDRGHYDWRHGNGRQYHGGLLRCRPPYFRGVGQHGQ